LLLRSDDRYWVICHIAQITSSVPSLILAITRIRNQ
jgi:hypothetical protein